MTLKEKREQWEKGGEEQLVTVHAVGSYKTVYVIVSFTRKETPFETFCTTLLVPPLNKYSLHRYFKIGEDWEISVDVNDEEIGTCLAWITSDFNDLYPHLKG